MRDGYIHAHILIKQVLWIQNARGRERERKEREKREKREREKREREEREKRESERKGGGKRVRERRDADTYKHTSIQTITCK